jgi:uncharacterized protein (TIGR00290 family)
MSVQQDKLIKVIVSWSSGKDSCLSFMRLQADPRYQVVGVITSYFEDYVPFQEIPIALIRQQISQLNLPSIEVKLPAIFPENQLYQKLMCNALKNSGIAFDAVAFGDMFCNGIAEYRRSYIEPMGWQCLFPLMQQSSEVLADEIIQSNIETRICSVDTEQLDRSFLARRFDKKLLKDLPSSIDPCGENGEFHTFVQNAPCFSQALELTIIDENHDGRFHHLIYDC